MITFAEKLPTWLLPCTEHGEACLPHEATATSDPLRSYELFTLKWACGRTERARFSHEFLTRWHIFARSSGLEETVIAYWIFQDEDDPLASLRAAHAARQRFYDRDASGFNHDYFESQANAEWAKPGSYTESSVNEELLKRMQRMQEDMIRHAIFGNPL